MNQTQIIRIQVPRDTECNYQVTVNLLKQWSTLSKPLKLIVAATPQAITWQIEVFRTDKEALVQSLRTPYPQANIEVEDKQRAGADFRIYNLHIGYPFIYPLLTAKELGKIDFIASLSSAMGALKGGEETIYELNLLPITEEQRDLGNKLFDEIKLGYSHADRSLLNGKLAATLKVVQIAIKIKASSGKRADQILDVLWPSLAMVVRDGINSLTWPQKEKTYTPILSLSEISALWHLPSEQCNHPNIQWTSNETAPWLGDPIRKGMGVKLGINTHLGKQKEVDLPYTDRGSHVSIVGRTGFGKSSLLFNMIQQDIANGKGVGVIDPHGDLVRLLLATGIPPEREKDVVFFDTQDVESIVGLNPLRAPDGLTANDMASLTLGIVRKMFEDEWSKTRMEDALYAALISLMSVPGTRFQDIPRLFHDGTYRDSILKQVTDPVALEFWHDEYIRSKIGHQKEIAAPITRRIRRFYRDPKMRNIICQESSLDFREILDSQKIFLADLSNFKEVEQEVLGALLVSKIQLAAMSRNDLRPDQRLPFYFYIDEVQSFVTTSLSDLLSEARKFGINLVIANQYLRQLKGDTLDAVLGNVGMTILFNLGRRQDANEFANLVKPQYTAESIQKLDKFKTIISMNHNHQQMPAFNMRTLPPPELNASNQERVEKLRQLSNKKYAKPRAEIEAELITRYQSSEDSETDSEGDYIG